MSAVSVEGLILSAQEQGLGHRDFVSREGDSHEAEGDNDPEFGRDEQEGE